ncbi:MAG: phosphatase PAP2 family protein [Lachnospiraceae bacterium]|nr:phosphatase PAP2 family protein [Lachnospiraceae bacterium]
MGQTFSFTWEAPFMAGLQETLGESAIHVLSHLSFFGEQIFLIFAVGLLYWCIDKEFGIAVGRTVLFANVCNTMIKNIFVRRRPYFDHEGIRVFRPVDKDADIMDIAAQGFSFPSGHATNSFATMGAIAHYGASDRGKRILSLKIRRLIQAAVLFLPFLVGFSRVVVGVHYPTDVICGWVLGVGCVFLIPFLHKRLGDGLFTIVILLFAASGFFYCSSDDYFSSMGLLLGFYAAIFFEARFVRFSGTREPVRCIVRIFFGALLFFVMNRVMKLPFSADFLDNGSLASHLVRTLRYTLATFVVLGIYPMAFGRFPGIFGVDKKENLQP